MWYRVVVTTPAGACDSEPEAGSVIGNFEMNGGSAQSFSGFNQTFLPGTTPVPALGSNPVGGIGALFPGEYEFTTLVTDSNLVAACFGTVIETQVFLETVHGA
jgi:hypothetical protein